MKITIQGNEYFKRVDWLTQIYILLYVTIMFSGSTFLHNFESSLVLLFCGLLFVICFVKGVIHRVSYNTWCRTPFFLLILFDLFLLFQMTMSYVPGITWVYVKRYLLFSAFLLLLPEVNMAYCCIKFSKYYSFLVSISIIVMTLVRGEKTGGLVGDYQYAGMLMSIACILFLIDYFNNNNNVFDLIGIVFSVFALFMSGKRMFALIAGCSFFVIYSFSNYPGKRRRFWNCAVIGLIGIVVGYLAVPEIRELFNRIVSLSDNRTSMMSGRDVLWEKAVEIFKENVWSGIGFGSFEKYFGNHYSISGISAFLTHNIYFGLLAETGIVGTTLYLCFMVYTFLRTLRINTLVRRSKYKEIRYVYLCSLMMQIWFIVYGFTGNGIYDITESFIYFTAIANVLSIERKIEREFLDYDGGGS